MSHHLVGGGLAPLAVRGDHRLELGVQPTDPGRREGHGGVGATDVAQVPADTNRDSEYILLINTDLFMAPDDAKAYGIIDEVYTTPDQSLISEARSRGALGGEGPAESQAERDRDAARPQKG